MKIVAVKKDKRGIITEYKLDNQQVVSQQEAISMVQNGNIENCNVFATKDGDKAIRSDADGNPDNNLDNLEIF